MYPDINTVWSIFQGYFMAMTDLVMYRPAWEAYLYQALSEFADDNVLYVEFRGTLPPVSPSVCPPHEPCCCCW